MPSMGHAIPGDCALGSLVSSRLSVGSVYLSFTLPGYICCVVETTVKGITGEFNNYNCCVTSRLECPPLLTEDGCG